MAEHFLSFCGHAACEISAKMSVSGLLSYVVIGKRQRKDQWSVNSIPKSKIHFTRCQQMLRINSFTFWRYHKETIFFYFIVTLASIRHILADKSILDDKPQHITVTSVVNKLLWEVGFSQMSLFYMMRNIFLRTRDCLVIICFDSSYRKILC